MLLMGHNTVSVEEEASLHMRGGGGGGNKCASFGQ